tara:strand:+ start:965 stop:1309 length:345 start_codon:yes stop_codon:yes gene_type:complete
MRNTIIGILFFILGNIIAWFQFNAQFLWPWWKSRPLVPQFLFAIPMGLCFWYAIKYIVEESGALWTSKLVGFGVGHVVFAIMTYVFMKEDMFTTKTMTCLFLSSIIIGIQIFWK